MTRTPRRPSRFLPILAVPVALAALSGAAVPAFAQGTGSDAVDTLLGGSFFPFARSFPAPPQRCLRAADKLRDRRNDGTLNAMDFRKLRKIGCAGAGAF